MCSRNSADQKREGKALGAWEGKIKGRGTSARASHGLHMGFAGTTLSFSVPCGLEVLVPLGISACFARPSPIAPA